MEGDDREYARLRWRCRRGMLELDLILMAFLDRHYHELEGPDRLTFERLLRTQDRTLLAYLQGEQRSDDKELMRIVNKIRQTADY